MTRTMVLLVIAAAVSIFYAVRYVETQETWSLVNALLWAFNTGMAFMRIMSEVG